MVLLAGSNTVDFDPAAFITAARAAQAARGKMMRGPLNLDEYVQQGAAAAVKDLSLKQDFNNAALAAPLQDLLLRFLEMARRNRISVPERAIQPIAGILLNELAQNVAAFKADQNPSEFVSLTLHQGAGCAFIHQDPEFTDFADTPGIFKHAAVHTPSDPRGFLRRVQADIRTIATEPEFTDFTDTPGIFKRGAVHTPSDPRGFLRRVQADIRTIAAEPEFTDFADTPGIFKYAAVNNPADPRGFLRRVQSDIKAMAAEPEFTDFADTPGLFKHAAVHNPADPRGFLRRVQADIKAMAAEPEFTDFADTPGIFKHAAVNNPTDPRGFLRGILDGSIVDERWKQARATPKPAVTPPSLAAYT